MSMKCDRCPKIGFVKRCEVVHGGSSTVLDLCGECRFEVESADDTDVYPLKAKDICRGLHSGVPRGTRFKCEDCGQDLGHIGDGS